MKNRNQASKVRSWLMVACLLSSLLVVLGTAAAQPLPVATSAVVLGAPSSAAVPTPVAAAAPLSQTAPALVASTAAGTLAATTAPAPTPTTAATVETKKPNWWESLLIIVYADAVMSVENVLIIAILVSAIPARIRMVAVFFGLIAAGAFRIGFACMATVLMKYPVVALLGAITLTFLAVSLFTDTIKQLRKKPEEHAPEEKIDFAVVKEELRRMFTEKGFWRSKEGEALKTVMSTVILQDVLLSLDNVLVVAGNSHGDLHLTIVGVLISIVMMGTIANLMVTLVKRYPILGLIGGLALAKAAHNLFIESYNHEAAVAAFGTIVVFVMFSRVYQRLTTDDEEVKPLSLDLDEPLTEGNEAGEVDVPEAPAAALAVPATAMMPHDVTQELLTYLRRNTDALQRIEATLCKRGGSDQGTSS